MGYRSQLKWAEAEERQYREMVPPRVRAWHTFVGLASLFGPMLVAAVLWWLLSKR